MCTTQPTAVVRHPTLAVHGSYPALLPLGVAGEAVERQGGARCPSVPTAGHHTCVNHSKGHGESVEVRIRYLSGALTPKMVAEWRSVEKRRVVIRLRLHTRIWLGRVA